MIPFLNLKELNSPYEEQFRQAFDRVLASGWYIQGPEVRAFEAEFAAYCGVAGCVGVSNGLDAIQLILRAYGIGAGDEVIVPSNTFIATWLAVTFTGAEPVAVEPDEQTFNISPELVENAITPRTRAIIAVHLYGRPAPMNALKEIAARRGLKLIEDAAQAHGAEYDGRKTGALSDAAAFSFYPGKNLGALGDAGAVTSGNEDLLKRVRELANYGSSAKYKHDTKGMNCRLDELQAAFLRVKLPSLDAENSRRRAIAAHYSARIETVKVPQLASDSKPAWHLYVVRTHSRESFQEHLTREKVATLVHYPLPPHLQGAYRGGRYRAGDLPVSERLHAEVVSLPMSPVLTDEQVGMVIGACNSFAPV